jgi:hypothetical protein
MPNLRRRKSDVDRPSVADDRRTPPTGLSVDDIRGRVYELYEARGGEPGRDLDDWLQAESKLPSSRLQAE